MIIFTQDLTPELTIHLESLGLGIQYISGTGWAPLLEGVTDEQVNQAITDFKPAMPDITPRQFYYLLLITGLDVHLPTIISSIKAFDLYLYADIKSQLDKGTVYFYERTWNLLQNPLIAQGINQLLPDLDLSESNVRALWMIAANHQPSAV